MNRFLAVCVLLAACSDQLPSELPAQEVAGASAEALTGPTAYTYTNSNNNASLSNDDIWLQAIRCWAKVYHAQAGHNYWTCDHSTSTALFCTHSPAATSGVHSMYLSACSNTSFSCQMRISFDGESASQKPQMGTVSWSPTAQPGEIRSYDFFDGGFGSCSANVGTGVFSYWSP